MPFHGSDDDPGLPIKLGPASNGEYDPEPLPAEGGLFRQTFVANSPVP